VYIIFVGLPKNFQNDDYTPPSEVPCIIDHLCKKHDGIPVEAKGIKEYSWKTHIRKLFDTGVSVFVLNFDFYIYGGAPISADPVSVVYRDPKKKFEN
jgi:hypothetical protein